MDLHYSDIEDRIIATRNITDMKGFLSLNYDDRKELLHDVLNLLYFQICFLTVCDEINPYAIKKREIIIKLMLERIDSDIANKDMENDTFADLISPDDILRAVRAAECRNEKFTYHEDYFMGIETKDTR